MPGNYVEINTSVRNDFPCPQCKTHTIKFIKNINPTESLLNRLHRITWVDKWERRGNGDRCQVIKINPDVEYSLNVKNVKSSEHDIPIYHNQFSCDIKYLILYINANKRKNCPDNFVHNLIFVENISVALEIRNRYMKYIKFDANNVFNVAPIDDRSCDITMLINYDESECHYFEIIELVNGITYDLERRDIYKFAK
jgi:hypothetical protein